MIISGIALTLFVVGIGVLVTRLVVDPVRRAAGTAQRLAEGQLEQRMTVRGEDDLARLATSFNAMADSLQRQITQLEGLSQLQQRFTSDVSHELRTPLTTVQMAAEVLHEARGDFPPHVARSAELLRAELDRFEGLLTDLLEISRYDAGAAVLDSEPTDLGALVARVVAGMWRWPNGTSASWWSTGPTRPSSPRWTPAGWSGSCATWSATPSSTVRAGRSRSPSPPTGRPRPSPSATSAWGSAPPTRSTSSTGSGGPTPPGCAPSAAAGSGCRSAWRTRGCTAAGCRSGASPARGAVPAHAAARRGRGPHQLAAAAAPGGRPPPGEPA